MCRRIPGQNRRESDDQLPLLVILIWATGVCAFSVRLFGGWSVSNRLRKYNTHIVASSIGYADSNRLRSQVCLESCRRTTAIRARQSTHGPRITIRPVVLMPAAAFEAGQPADQVEALLFHELAHIRRHDYLVNMFQSGIEALPLLSPCCVVGFAGYSN